MRITFVTRKFGNVERNSHCDVLHITPIRVARLFLDCNGDFAIKAYYLRHDALFTKTRLGRQALELFGSVNRVYCSVCPSMMFALVKR